MIPVHAPPTNGEFDDTWRRAYANTLKREFSEAVDAIHQPRIRQTTRDRRRVEALELATRYNDWLRRFGIRRKPIHFDNMEAEARTVRDRLQRADERKRRKREQEERKRLERAQAALDHWAGGRADRDNYHSVVGQYRGLFFQLPVRLRVNGDDIESSLGARVPKRKFATLYRRLKRARAQGSLDGLNRSIGIYHADELKADSIVIGCHNVGFTEIDRIAMQLGAACAS